MTEATLGPRVRAAAAPAALVLLLCWGATPLAAQAVGQAEADTLWAAEETVRARTLPDSLGPPVPSGAVSLGGRVMGEGPVLPGVHGPVEASPALGAWRVVGSGWRGHRRTLAGGVAPASLSCLALDGRSADDWIGGGLALMEAYAAAGAVVVCESGPDLSTWPLRLDDRPPLAWSGVSGAGLGPGVGVGLFSAALASSRPVARVMMSSGDLGFRATGLRFGRRYFDGEAGLELFLHRREGRAPVPDGGHDLDSFGGRASIALRDGWVLDLSGMRSTYSRSLPFAGLSPGRLAVDGVRSDATATALNGETSVSIFHTESWYAVAAGEGGQRGVESVTDGVRLTLPLGFPVADRLTAEVGRASASGDALTGPLHAVRVSAAVERTVRVGRSWALALVAGADRSRGEIVPLAGAALVDGDETRWLRLDLGGRHPSALELSLRRVAIPSTAAGAPSVGGNRSLGAERSVSLRGGWRLPRGAFEAGCEVEYDRVLDPVVLLRDGDEIVPGNARDESGASLTGWASVSPSPECGASVFALSTFLDEDGALNALAPVPRALLGASVWRSVSLFRDYLKVRISVAVRHETGLARGPWSDAIEDSGTDVDGAVAAKAGVARIFVAAENLLEADPASLPGRPRSGRRLSAGFSWTFWD